MRRTILSQGRIEDNDEKKLPVGWLYIGDRAVKLLRVQQVTGRDNYGETVATCTSGRTQGLITKALGLLEQGFRAAPKLRPSRTEENAYVVRAEDS